MKKCLRVGMNFAGDGDFLQLLQRHGTKLSVEGTIQFIAGERLLRIIVCGNKVEVDKFIDLLHKESVKIGSPDIQVEPFIRDKDYRGVMRIIE